MPNATSQYKDAKKDLANVSLIERDPKSYAGFDERLQSMKNYIVKLISNI